MLIFEEMFCQVMLQYNKRSTVMAQDSEKIIVRIDPDLKELVPEFIQRRHTDVAMIAAALRKDDYEAIRILGHSMKGAGGGYGFDVISDIGRNLEQAAKNRQTEEIQLQKKALSGYLERLEIVYD